MNKFRGNSPLVYLITNGALTADNYAESAAATLALIEHAVEAQISLIQLREKLLPARLLFDLSARAAQITQNSETKLLVNDRADVALAAGADGVHLTSLSLAAAVVRANFPPPFIIGVSAHRLAEVQQAQAGGADFATFSPVFATPSKSQYGAPQGLAKLREVVETVGEFPVIALGGIDTENYSETLKTGAKGIAAIRLLNDPANWNLFNNG